MGDRGSTECTDTCSWGGTEGTLGTGGGTERAVASTSGTENALHPTASTEETLGAGGGALRGHATAPAAPRR